MPVDWAAIAPEVVVAAAACVILVGDLLLRRRARAAAGAVALAALAVALGGLLRLGGQVRVTFGGMFVVDGFALVAKAFFLAVGMVVVLVSLPSLRGHRYEGEYYFLLLTSILGTMLMPSSRNLLMLFVSLELVSAPAFVVAGLRKRDPRSNEAALKFFLFGVLSAGVLVYGISLLYGLTGTTDLATMAARLRQGLPSPGGGDPDALALVGIVLVVAAFGFKVSAVPFHFWAPDAYEGSPVPLAAFLGVGSKAAGFVGLLLLLLVAFGPLAGSWAGVVGGLALATMTVGNLMALRQRHLVRLLAYSGIAHAGYLLIPLAILRPGGYAPNVRAVSALVVYFFIYLAMNLGAFAVAVGLSKQYPTLLLRDLAGLGRRAPLQAAALGAFMISLGGIPPFAGWAAKFFVFLAAVQAGSRLGVVLAVAMVVNSVISLYYYVGVVRTMYMQAPEEEGAVRFAAPVTAAILACLVATVLLGIFPDTLVRIADAARVAVP